MSRASLVFAFVFALSLCACTSLLGDFNGSSGSGPEADASADSSNGGDSTAGDSGMPVGDSSSPGDSTTPTGDSGNPNDSATTEAGTDASVCNDGAKQCVGNGVETCTNGTWGTAVACPMADPYCNGAGVCGACMGVCMGQCTPGQTTCSAMGPQVCGSNGAWGTPTGCGTHQVCVGGGGDAGPAMCQCANTAPCTGAGLACDNGQLAQCGQDGMGCWYAASTTACTNGACFGNFPSALCCTNACTEGTYKCGGAGLQECVVQGNGCTGWNAGTACGPHQSCTTTGAGGSCTCNVDPNCSTVGTICMGTSGYATCAQDGNGCIYDAGGGSCEANSSCSGGTCSCNSGFTSCNGLCVDVNNNNNNCGACGHVCPVLASPSSGSTCGLLNAGQCAGYVGGYVTPNSGATANANPGGGDVFAVKATMPSVAGTLYAVGGLFGSTATSGSTQIIMGLFSDNGLSPGGPDNNLFYTENDVSQLEFNDPSGLVRLTAGGGEYLNGFSNALAPNTTYWVYLKAGTDGSNDDTAGISTAACAGEEWINLQPQGTWGGVTQVSCPADFSVYMIVTFP
jgi:hypothetical protein